MTRERDHWFKFNSAKWRDGTRGLSPAAKGIYTDVISLLHETPDAGYVDDARKIASDLGYRDYRTVAAPLAELKASRKLLVWRGRLYNAKVCRDRHELAVKRRKRSPVPEEVWALIEAAENAIDDGVDDDGQSSPPSVDDAVDNGGNDAQQPPEMRRSSADDRPMIENSGRQVSDFPRSPRGDLETDQEEVVAVRTRFRARGRRQRQPWARAGPLLASA